MNGKNNMLIALCCVAVYGCAAAPRRRANDDDEIKDFPTFMKRFDKINVEQVLKNERVLNGHLKCFINEGPCVQQSRDLKKVIPVIARTGCEGCTPKQKSLIKRTLNHLRTKKPVEWKKLTKIYDPTGKNLPKFLDS